MRYSYEMQNEAPVAQLLPEGKNRVVVSAMELYVKKAETFKTTFSNDDGAVTVYLPTEKGKRFRLKQLLEAAGEYEKDENDNYSFDTDNVVGKTVIIEVKNKEERFINRDGEEKEVTKNELINIFSDGDNSMLAKKDKEDEEIPF